MLFNWIKENYISVIILGMIAFAAQTAVKSAAGSEKKVKFISAAAGILYMFVLIYVTLTSRENGTEHKYELHLFWSYRKIIREGNRFLLWENIANIFAFVPLGMFLYDFAGEKWNAYQAAIVGMVCSVLIECTQLIGKLGLFEFDDIFHNTLGTFAGYLLAVLICRIVAYLLKKQQRAKEP